MTTPEPQVSTLPDSTVGALSDLSEIVSLLRACNLPVEDLRPDAPPLFFGVRRGARPVGVVGLQVSGTVALLRSLAVAPQERGGGLGAALVARAEAEAGARGVRTLYLLTTTAAGFFRRLGFAPADRAAVPAAIGGTAQFSELCPASSAFMAKVLGAGGSP